MMNFFACIRIFMQEQRLEIHIHHLYILKDIFLDKFYLKNN